MIFPDVNPLLNAHNGDSRDHELARRWWETVVNLTTDARLSALAIER